jgi:hypothetical protein
MPNITWEIFWTIAITAFITSTFNAIAQYFVYKFLIKHLDTLGKALNGKETTKKEETDKLPNIRK